jgi:predicted anti-sigma-YlaC factor YlaD
VVEGRGKALDAGRTGPDRRKVYHPGVRWAILAVLGALLGLAGVVWVLQGLGVIVTSSFMTGDRLWVVLGAVAAVGGGALSWWAWSRRSRRPA